MSVISRSMGLALGSARNLFRLRASAIIAQHMYLDTTSFVPSGALGAHPSPPLGYALRFFSSRPPYTELNMPALSPTMEQGNLSKWHVKEGEEVAPGTVLADVETDKATLAFENQEEGFIAKLLVAEGSKDIPVGTPLALLVEEASHVAAFQDFTPGAEAPTAAPASSTAVAADPAAAASSYPPHQMLGMPALSPTMEQGSIGKWLVSEGAEIAPGQLLVEVETDKATLGLENQDEGFLAKILAPNGSQDIKVGEPIAVIVEDEAAVAAFANFTLASASAAPSAAAPQASAPAVDAAPATGPAPDSRIGPAAQHALDVAGLSKEDCIPTGPHNIVTWHDVQLAMERRAKGGATPKVAAAPAPAAPSAQAPAAAPTAAKPVPPGSTYEDMPTSTIRGIIAKRLTEAKQTVPALYMSAVANLDSMNSVRSGLKDAGIKVSVNDFVVRAVALALKEVPRANALWDAAKGEAVSADSVDISIAVSTPSGLITPIVFAADGKSVAQIGGEVRDLAKRARDNKLKPEEFQGGSFSISNLGMFGIDSFCAIINPPQACIMAVGGTQERVVLEAGNPVVKQEMTVMLSADNRVYDEELAALFLEAFCNNISNPAKLLA